MVIIPIENILPNPWQTRLGDPDPEYIKELADDIASNGLLQAPVGRFVNGEGEPVIVQLAFGHNRLAAFKSLAESIDNWNVMPVEIRELSDQEMATFAWAENEKRRDVTPIERARAIQKRIEDFGWTQEMTANQLGISRSAVTNVLRLLKLPEGIRAQIQKGEMSERAAISLLSLFDLPESLRNHAEHLWPSEIRPSEIIQAAMQGISSDELRRCINRMMGTLGKNLENAEWGLDDEIAGDGIRAVTCRGCEARIAERNLCTDPNCYGRKEITWMRSYLEKASEASGIPVVEPDLNLYQISDLDRWPTNRYAQTILQTGCENLRLKYEERATKEISLEKLGFPHAEITCRKRSGYCTCTKGLEMQKTLQERQANEPQPFEEDGDDLEEEAEAEYIPDVAPAADTGPTAEELEELARQARQEKREISQRIAFFKQKFAEQIAMGLLVDNPAAWHFLASEISYKIDGESYKEQESPSNPQDIRLAIGKYIAEQNTPYEPKNIYEILSRWNAILEECGLELLSLEEQDAQEIPDKVQEILETWQETKQWIHQIEEEPPTLDILQQKIQLLEALANAAGDVDDAWRDHLDPLYQDAALDELILRLYDLKAVLEHPSWSTDGIVYIGYLIKEAYHNFEPSLRDAPAHILAYALAMVSGVEGKGMMAGKIRARLLEIQQKQEINLNV